MLIISTFYPSVILLFIPQTKHSSAEERQRPKELAAPMTEVISTTNHVCYWQNCSRGERPFESKIMDKKEEVMGDAIDEGIDDALGDAVDEEETDQIVNRVLDELGNQLGEEMAGLPSAAGGLNAGGEKVGGRQAVAAGGGSGANGSTEVDDDLQACLDQLRQE